MKLALGMAIGMLALAAPAKAHDPAIEAPITQFVDAFNKGDAARAKDAMMSTGAVIIDEVPPFRWAGPRAFENWGTDDARDAALNGIAAQKVVIGAPTREMVNGNHAYVIVPAVYSFTKKRRGDERGRADDVRSRSWPRRVEDRRLDLDRPRSHAGKARALISFRG